MNQLTLPQHKDLGIRIRSLEAEIDQLILDVRDEIPLRAVDKLKYCQHLLLRFREIMDLNLFEENPEKGTGELLKIYFGD